MRTLIAVLLVVTIPVGAEEMECGTSPEHVQWVLELGTWSALKAEAMLSKGATTAAATRRGELFEVPADITNTPFRNPFDLQGRTLIFERVGGNGFRASTAALDWHEDNGTRVALGGESGHAVVTLNFDFPFFDRNVRTVFVTPNNGIYLEPPMPAELRQYGEAELAGEQRAVIAPLLSTRSSRLTPVPEVFVRRDANSAAITWSSPDRYRIRATLFADGEIRFSYQSVTSAPSAGSVLITSGRETWRAQRTQLSARADAVGDLRSTVPTALSGMLDITNVAVERVGDLDLYAVRIRTSTAVQQSAIPTGESIQFLVRIGEQFVRLQLYADGRQRYWLPVWGNNWASTAARMEGDEIVLTFLREHIAYLSAVPMTVWSYRNSTNIDSSDVLSIAFPLDGGSVRTDFSAANGDVLEGRPIAEAFTTPVLSVQRVWEQVKQAHPSLSDAAIDGVAIYQNFYTDIVTYAGAYSTGGNPQVSGLWQGDQNAPFQSRTPALMHMNTIGYGHNRTLPGASRVVLHELGHRWLLFASLLENGQKSNILNPVSAHPAQYVDTRAAFKVYTDTDTSVMGGGLFTDHGDGTFSSGPYGPYSYSWLDLYLMGLAAAEEVPPMFYVGNSSPALGGEYYAPANQTYSGTRRDFTVQQVIDGTGARQPSFPNTQRNFRVVFVLVSDPDRPVTNEELAAVNDYRSLLENDFRTATNSRGSVSSVVEQPPAGTRRRAAGK
jgi:hypothetical protein